MDTTAYRPLTQEEVQQLKQQGNRCDDWSQVQVLDPFAPQLVQGNTFVGEVRMGRLDKVPLPVPTTADALIHQEGISDSTLCNCTLGDHCAVHQVRLLVGYRVGDRCTLFNLGELVADRRDLSENWEPAWMEVMNECGGRRILPFPGMTIGDALLWARFRGRPQLMQRLEAMTREQLGSTAYATIGNGATLCHTQQIRNVAVLSEADDPTTIEACVALQDGVVGLGCHLSKGVVAERFLLGEHVHLEFGLRLNDSVVGDNATLARCEVGCSLIFPAHEQHHNNSFLIAALVEGQSNVAAGATLGSNHNSRTADNELVGKRGFWPGLCCSLKHSSRFASYTLLAKGDYPYELDIPFPFALVNNNVAQNQLEVMPAYWWLYNMYALDRCSRKFAARDRRRRALQPVEFSPLAPDTAEEILSAMALLREGRPVAMEHSRRPVVLLKQEQALSAYEEMLLYFALGTLREAYPDQLPPDTLGAGTRQTVWFNVGGQLVAADDMASVIADIEQGRLASWDEVHARWQQLWRNYGEQKCRHAYQVLCLLWHLPRIDAEAWQRGKECYEALQQKVSEQVRLTRKKDDDNPFRQMTYLDAEERKGVLGT